MRTATTAAEGGGTRYQTFGWVRDKDAANRRLQLYRVSAFVIGIAVEAPDERRITLELDAAGFAALWQAVYLAAGVPLVPLAAETR